MDKPLDIVNLGDDLHIVSLCTYIWLELNSLLDVVHKQLAEINVMGVKKVYFDQNYGLNAFWNH